MLAPNAPTGSYNADFSNIYVGSYRFIWAVSKIYLLRHEKINKFYAAKPRNTPLCMYIHTNDAQKKKSFSPSLCQINTFLLPFPQPCSGRSLVGAGEQKSLSHTTSSCCGGPIVRVVPEGQWPPGKQRLPGPGADDQPQAQSLQAGNPDYLSKLGTTLLPAQHQSQGTTAHQGCEGALPQILSWRGNTKPSKEQHLPYRHTGCLPLRSGRWSINKTYV